MRQNWGAYTRLADYIYSMVNFQSRMTTCCSVTKSCWTICDPMGFRVQGFPVLHYFSEFAQTMSIVLMMPSNHLILLLLSIFLSIRVFSNQSVLCISWPEYWSFSFSISPSNKYSGQFFQDWLVWSPFSLRDSQESSPGPQFETINSFMLSLLYSPFLIPIHDYWKNHSFDYTDLCWESDLYFLICCLNLS